MANTNVYPFGAGGSLPASVGIVNDLTTGGADKALAAQQGVVLKGMIDAKSEVASMSLPNVLDYGKGSYNPASNTDIQDKFALGYMMSGSGTSMSANGTYCVSPYCKVEPGATYQVYVGFNTKAKARYVTFFNGDKVYQSYSDNPGESAVTIPAGCHYARFTLYQSNLNSTLTIVKTSEPFCYANFREGFIPADSLDYNGVHKEISKFSDFSGSKTLAQNGSLYLSDTHGRSDVTFSAVINGANNADLDVLFGVGRSTYEGLWFELTPTKLILHKHLGDGQYDSTKDTETEYTHGLTLNALTVVTFSGQFGEGKVKILSGGYTFEQDIDKDAYGAGGGFAINLAETSVTVSLRVFNKGIAKKVWLIGDSYLDWSIDARWLYWLKQWGYTNWYELSLPGARSDNMFPSLRNNLSIGKPVYAVWIMGMNDGSDSEEIPVERYSIFVQNFIEICKECGVIPVLATIPSVKQRDMRAKNSFVRSSGYRYIDFAAAVESPLGDYPNYWYGNGTVQNLLSYDYVHPTALGAKALALRALVDFPELMLND